MGHISSNKIPLSQDEEAVSQMTLLEPQGTNKSISISSKQQGINKVQTSGTDRATWGPWGMGAGAPIGVGGLNGSHPGAGGGEKIMKVFV